MVPVPPVRGLLQQSLKAEALKRKPPVSKWPRLPELCWGHPKSPKVRWQSELAVYGKETRNGPVSFWIPFVQPKPQYVPVGFPLNDQNPNIV